MKYTIANKTATTLDELYLLTFDKELTEKERCKALNEFVVQVEAREKGYSKTRGGKR